MTGRRSCLRALRLPIVASALAVCALAPAAASAGVVSSDGNTITYGESPANEANDLSIQPGTGYVDFSDAVGIDVGSGCAVAPGGDAARCPLGAGGVQVSTGGGNDRVRVLEFEEQLASGALRVDLGDGDDSFAGDGVGTENPNGPGEVVSGGNGNDHLDGRAGDDVLDGGPGNDTVLGGLGPDRVLGGPGDDTLEADLYSDRGIWADMVDGGDGVDSLREYLFSGEAAAAPAVSVTYDGAANDGRPSEGDNLIGIERLVSGSAGSFTGDDGANAITAPETGAASTMDGRGGDDALTAGDAHGDSLNGGPGADELAGGFGDDTITGGAGPDRISGDRPARCNELHCDISGGHGNDTIDARDGEVDSVVCGPGTDRVLADSGDTVAADCEQVERASGGGGPAAGGGDSTAARLATVGRVRLRTALRRGFLVSVTGLPAGRVTVVATVSRSTARRLRLSRRAVTVASGRGRASAAGNAQVRLRFTRAAKRRLGRARSVKLTLAVRGTTARRTVTLR